MTDEAATGTTATAIAEKVITALTSAAKASDEKTAQGALARGIVYQNASYIEEALDSFQEALSLDSNSHEAAARLALTQLRARQPAAALETAMRLAARAPDYAMPEITSDERVSAFTILGNTLIANNRVDDAIAAYETARKEYPADSTAAARLAQIFIAKGEAKKAVDQESAFQKNPRFQRLRSLISLAKRSGSLLPSYDVKNLGSFLALDAHGRPYLVEGRPLLAELADDGTWCLPLPNVLVTLDRDV